MHLHMQHTHTYIQSQTHAYRREELPVVRLSGLVVMDMEELGCMVGVMSRLVVAFSLFYVPARHNMVIQQSPCQ